MDALAGRSDFQPVPEKKIDEFVSRWENAGGSERANYQLFLTELCTLLKLPQPDPAGAETAHNTYVFERRVDINWPDGSSSPGFIDLYRKGSFVLEAKQTGKTLDTQGWDKAMLKAQNQADQYVRAIPVSEGRRGPGPKRSATFTGSHDTRQADLAKIAARTGCRHPHLAGPRPPKLRHPRREFQAKTEEVCPAGTGSPAGTRPRQAE